MTAALEGGEWSPARPGRALPPGKTRYPFYRRLGGLQGRSRRAKNLFPTGIRSRTLQPVVSRYTDWATRPTFSTYLEYFSGVKRRRCEVNHSPPSNAEVKNEWSYASASPVCHHGMEKEKLSYVFRLRKFNTLKQTLWIHAVVTYRPKSIMILTWHFAIFIANTCVLCSVSLPYGKRCKRQIMFNRKLQFGVLVYEPVEMQ